MTTQSNALFHAWVRRWNIGPGMNDRPPRTHYTGFDGTVGDGWIPLLDKLCEQLTELGWDGRVSQVKEKFGGLRFYAAFPTDWTPERLAKAHQFIGEAEDASEQTCEVCGKPGRLCGDYWVKTRCVECETA